jgi:hypothetical protein
MKSLINCCSTGLALSALVLAGCGSVPLTGGSMSSASADFQKRTEALSAREKLLEEQKRALAVQQNQVKAQLQQAKATRAPASAEPMAAAPKSSGADSLLPPNAKAGECYARVFSPPTYNTVTEQVLKRAESSRVSVIPAQYAPDSEQVLVREASKRIEVIPAQYEWVTERIMVSPASKRLVTVPAQMKTVTERVMVAAGYTTWKKGTGLIQKVDQTTGEIMCLVEVPPVYKNVTKTVEDSAPTTREIEIPAVYKTVKKQVLKQAATTREIEIPAHYHTVPTTKLVKPAQEVSVAIPAEYQTVERRELAKEGSLEWRSILCETNMTRGRVMDIQRALMAAGHNPGPIDGVIREQTMSAVNSYPTA